MNERKVAVVFLPSLESSSSRRRKKRPTSSTVWRRRRGRVKSRQAINQQTAVAAAPFAACLVVAEKKSFDTTRITFLNVRLLSARSEPSVARPGLAAARLLGGRGMARQPHTPGKRMLLHYHISRTREQQNRDRSFGCFFHNELAPTDSMPLLVRFERPIEKVKGALTTNLN